MDSGISSTTRLKEFTSVLNRVPRCLYTTPIPLSLSTLIPTLGRTSGTK